MSESIIGKKSFDFAVIIVNFYRKFIVDKKEFVLSETAFTFRNFFAEFKCVD